MSKYRHLPNSNPNETRDQVKPKNKSKLRAIDQGTIYDVTGKMRWLTRHLEAGNEGEITDAIILIRGVNGSIASFAFGPGNKERTHHMLSTVKNRMEPA